VARLAFRRDERWLALAVGGPDRRRPARQPAGSPGVHRTVDAAGAGWPAGRRLTGVAIMAAQPIR